MKDVELALRLFVGESGIHQIHLAAAGREAQAPLDLDVADSHLKGALDDVEYDTCSKETLREVGSLLWSAVMAGAVGELFETLRKEGGGDVRYLLRLRIEDPDPQHLDLLPWEALYEDGGPHGGVRFLATDPAYVIVRTPLAETPSAGEPSPLAGPLRILAVVPSGSGLDVAREVKNLEDCVARLKERVMLERLAGQVTPSRLRDKLRAGSWDVFHFIGHGQQSKSGRTEVRLNSEESLDEDFWLDGESLAGLFKGSGLRLAVLNCCRAGTAVEGRRLSGLAPSFLSAGVPAVVAMRYEIGDREANAFARELYQELLAGREPGRADLAVESARVALELSQPEDVGRPFITPSLFLSNSPRVFAFASRATAAPPAVITATPAPLAAAPAGLPAELLRVLASGQCVPVIGPRVLAADSVRSVPPASDLGQLARILAQRFAYPRPRDLELCEAAGDWMDTFLLQWVCQVAQASHRPRDLVEAIEEIYRGIRPPDILAQLAEWNVPGFFYLHFDGLLEEAFAGRSRRVRVAQGVDAAVPLGDLPLLVHVRGSYRDPASLVLTEEDHNGLWDRVGRMSQEIVNLVRGYAGRSLFFLGASPRDPLVKRLFSKLIEDWSERARGPLFFLCSSEEKGDPFWEQAEVEWIDADLAATVEALTAATRGGG